MINARRIDATSVDPSRVPKIAYAYRRRLGGDGAQAILLGVDADLIIDTAKMFFPLLIHHSKGIDVVTPRGIMRWKP